MKLVALLSQNFINHYNICHHILGILKLVNQTTTPENDLYIIENLTKNDIININIKYNAVWTRHNYIPSSFIELLSIPIFSQQEIAYNHMGNLNENYIYLTDKSYLTHFPNAETQLTHYVTFNYFTPISNRHFDLLFIGRYKEGKNEKNSDELITLSNILKSKVNDFLTSEELHNYLFKQKSKLSQSNVPRTPSGYKNFWHILHSFRNNRRDLIMEDIYKLADKNYHICLVIDKEGVNRIKPHPNITLYLEQHEDELNQLAQNSKCTIVQTPLHHSTLNERFTLALNNGSIPIFEPYPQYDDFSHLPLVFDYKERRLVNQISNLFEKEDLTSLLKEIKMICDVKLTPENFKNNWYKIIQKYTR